MSVTKTLEINGNDRSCELCGNLADCRPYGPGGKWICFPCAMKNEKAATERFLATIADADNIVWTENGVPVAGVIGMPKANN